MQDDEKEIRADTKPISESLKSSEPNPVPKPKVCQMGTKILFFPSTSVICGDSKEKKFLTFLFFFFWLELQIASTRFEDVLAFSGPGPERINGRLAMIGFVTAIGVELAKGQDLFSQINDGGLTWFVGTSVLLSLASLIPLFKGVRAEAKSEGFMSSDAELWNGRFAMLGLVALAFTEYLKGGALV